MAPDMRTTTLEDVLDGLETTHLASLEMTGIKPANKWRLIQRITDLIADLHEMKAADEMRSTMPNFENITNLFSNLH